MTIATIQNAIAPVLKQYGVSKAVLFGSYAQGCASEQSDVDLMVDSGLRGLAFTGLIEDLFGKLNKPVDVVDVTHIVNGSEIEKEIRQTGVTIYEDRPLAESHPKAESLSHISVGQRPTSRRAKIPRLKALRITCNSNAQGFQPRVNGAPFRRALPQPHRPRLRPWGPLPIIRSPFRARLHRSLIVCSTT